MPDDNDAEEKSTQPSGEPIDAFHDALAEVWIECHQLCAAVSRQDYEDAEIAANDAVSCWCVAQGALEYVAPGADDDDDRKPERRALLEAHHMLRELFVGLNEQVALPALRGVLSQLAIDLAFARSERSPSRSRSSK